MNSNHKYETESLKHEYLSCSSDSNEESHTSKDPIFEFYKKLHKKQSRERQYTDIHSKSIKLQDEDQERSRSYQKNGLGITDKIEISHKLKFTKRSDGPIIDDRILRFYKSELNKMNEDKYRELKPRRRAPGGGKKVKYVIVESFIITQFEINLQQNGTIIFSILSN